MTILNDEPMLVRNLERKIRALGDRLVRCSESCAGIRRDSNVGSLPRCLVLETSGRSAGRGAAVVGLNPGKASQAEEAFYRDHGSTYDATLEWFQWKHRKEPKYYVQLRRLLDELGITGPLLWTELVKCESAADVAELPIQTVRHCGMRYLNEELQLLPQTWPLIGVGSEAFKVLAYRYPERRVLGVPHPTGSYGHFSRLFTGRKKTTLKPSIKSTADDVLRSSIPIAARL